MNEKEAVSQKLRKKSSSPELVKRMIILFTFFLILIGIFIGWKNYHSPSVKTFELEKKDDKIVISNLSHEDIENIDWQEIRWIPTYLKEDSRQYVLTSPSIYRRLFRKPTVYCTWSPLKPEEIRDKEIEFIGSSSAKNIKISKSRIIYHTGIDMLAHEKESWLDWIMKIAGYVLLVLSLLWFCEMIFGVNIFSRVFSFFGSWSRVKQERNIPKTNFQQVGGLQEAKEELSEVVSYFRNPQPFHQRGAKVPKGILLVGPPGNGKTLLAKALAGECGLPFLFRSGSEFEEMLVGLGARRVRELFQKARSYPQGCIIFIDEIDSIGRRRYSINSNDLTLNQLLTELDGFRPHDNIVILAATNSLNVLDKALLRPGRFDRQIIIPPPNLKARREIINLSINKNNLKSDVDLEELAYMTKGFSGAQIVNMFNEASILSLRHNKKLIDQELIFEAFDRVLMGPSLISETLTPHKKKIIAYHEAGHAIVGLSLPETTVRKITIIPRWMAGGYTWITLRDEQGDDNMLNKSQILADVMSCLGGRASEELIFGSKYITMGAYSDFKNASELIRDLIFRYGMSDLGIIPTRESFFYGGEEIASELPESAKQKIENEREKILNQCWKKVKNILRSKKATLSLLAEILLERNSLQKEEINYIFVNQISPYRPLLPKNQIKKDESSKKKTNQK